MNDTKMLCSDIRRDTGCLVDCREVRRISNKDKIEEEKIVAGKCRIKNISDLAMREEHHLADLNASGSDSCSVGSYRHPQYGEVLSFSAAIPTFDVYDRQTDSYHDTYFLSDGENIHFVYVIGGYRLGSIKIGIQLTGADKKLYGWLKELQFPVANIQILKK